MTRRESKSRKCAGFRGLIDPTRSRIARINDERRLNQTLRSAQCRRMMNCDAIIRECVR